MHERAAVPAKTERILPLRAGSALGWCTLASAAVLAPPVHAQGLPPAAARQLDSLLGAAVGSSGPGCAVGVGMNGVPVYARGAGSAVIEHDIDISPRTTFNLGSISKQFTAYAALHLAREGRLALDDDIRRHVPEMPDYDAAIRVRDLLHHTSGLRDYVGLARLGDSPVRAPERGMHEFLALMARQRGLNFTPGTSYAYVHSDYNVLGLVLERATGQPLGDILAERIWRPLGMTSTRQLDEAGAPVAGQALSYSSGRRGIRTRFPVGALRGGTDVYSTAEDMLRWYTHLERPAATERDIVASFLARPTFANGDTIPYVHGIRHGSHRGRPVVFRGGHGAYFTADHLTFPAEGVTTLALCNSQATDSEELVRAMADVVLPDRIAAAADPAAAGPAVAAVTTPAAEGTRLTGVYFDPRTPWQRVAISVRDSVLHVGDGEAADVYPMRRLQAGRYRIGSNVLDLTTDASGRVQLRVTWPYGQAPTLAPRWDASPSWTVPRDALDGFTGTFYSEDVLHAFRIVREGDALVVRRAGRADARLVPLLPDVFSVAWESGHTVGVEFMRRGGHVVAVDVSDLTSFETVRRLRFDRIRMADEDPHASDP